MWGTIGAIASLALVTSCSSAGAAKDDKAAPGIDRSYVFGNAAPAWTYDATQVPVGGRAKVVVTPLSGDRTQVDLAVSGLQPNRPYGAHAHVKPCGATGDAAGPHYQHVKDPVSPSVDPRYANPKNEIWLDLTTDGSGNGTARSVVDWRFRPGQAGSIVIHKEHTKTHAGHAGTAGARLACVDVPF
jgi:Cu-Zn family superoxide dismutase